MSTIAETVERFAAELRVDLDTRRVIGITGPPGAGKSTFCALLADALAPDAAVVGMDGFHLADEELDRLGRRERKGAPDTFDVAGYVNLLDRLRTHTEEVVYAPRFRRDIEAAEAGAIAVPHITPIVLTEGNYLLLDEPGWDQVRSHLDAVWYLDVPADVRVERLIARHRENGRSAPDAEAWVHTVDMANADLVASCAERADQIIAVPDER